MYRLRDFSNHGATPLMRVNSEDYVSQSTNILIVVINWTEDGNEHIVIPQLFTTGEEAETFVQEQLEIPLSIAGTEFTDGVEVAHFYEL